MKSSYSVLGLQVEGMLEGIAEERDARVREILEAGRRQADELIAQARLASRRRVRETLREERAQMDRQIQQESAGLATAARVHRLRVQRDRLERGHGLAADALRERWGGAEERRAWMAAAVEAAAVLEPGAWTVRHAAGASAEELEQLRIRLAELAGEAPALEGDETLDAGLRIFAQDLRLDLSVEGLLRDRERIEGLLLAMLLEAGGPDDEDG